MADTTPISEATVHRLCRDVDGRLLLARKSARTAYPCKNILDCPAPEQDIAGSMARRRDLCRFSSSGSLKLFAADWLTVSNTTGLGALVHA